MLSWFRAVHPDRTLRKNKRSMPRMRPIPEEDAFESADEQGQNAAKMTDFFLVLPAGESPCTAAPPTRDAADSPPEQDASVPKNQTAAPALPSADADHSKDAAAAATPDDSPTPSPDDPAAVPSPAPQPDDAPDAAAQQAVQNAAE
jgi:hypothetical protein